MLKLFDHQIKAVSLLKTGSILNGGVGSGKSITALAYFYTTLGGEILEDRLTPVKEKKDLYVITTAAKRDTLDWEREALLFLISTKRELSPYGIVIKVDSWNNIGKYDDVKNAFFIFDEQRVVGSGSWAKYFVKIAKKNDWILLSATPADNWMDYIAVFIANKFYKNRTEFVNKHVEYNPYTKYPSIKQYHNIDVMEHHKKEITVNMDYNRTTTPHWETIFVQHDKDLFKKVIKTRWNIYENQPIKQLAEFSYILRRVINSDPSRLRFIAELLNKHPRLIIFYSFDYELDILRHLNNTNIVTEYNGHKHEPISLSDSWIHLVQYNSGAEGWNCITTNAMVFYSLSYSYRMMTQAAGRIDRLNTMYLDVYYYQLASRSFIDLSILRCLKNKKDFNGRRIESLYAF